MISMAKKALAVKSLIPAAVLESRICMTLGQNTMLDSDLAKLYQVTTSNFNKTVQRNLSRFPEDFMFQLIPEEWEALRARKGSAIGRGGRRYMPFVFTEQGVAMLSSVLKSQRAVQVNIAIMRTFVHLREATINYKDLVRKISEMESKYDGQFQAVFGAIRKLMEPSPAPGKRRIGFSASAR